MKIVVRGLQLYLKPVWLVECGTDLWKVIMWKYSILLTTVGSGAAPYNISAAELL